MKKALLAVSFGTSQPQAREAIRAVEERIRQAVPDRDFFRSFTSPTIRRILKGRGEIVDSLEEALDRLAREGYMEVAVQPTHFLYGWEYDKIKETVQNKRELFACLKLGRPLLADSGDIRRLAVVLKDRYGQEEAVVWMGHGTSHFANAVYPALQTAFTLLGQKNIYVGTVEGWPALEDVLAQLKQDRRRHITLVPLMLVAGEHAMKDMAGESEESWASRLSASGFAVDCRLEGLGLLPEIQAMYENHVRELI